MDIFSLGNLAALFAAVIVVAIVRKYLIAQKRVRKLLKDDGFWIGKEGPFCASTTKASIIIPARNEQMNIKACVEHALAQTHENIEVIVLDDNSSDDTLKILQQFDDPRLKIIQGAEEPPEGWRGKPWACQRAAKQAQGDWLMFIDADVRIAPETVAATVGYCQQEKIQFLTGLDKHVMRSFAERALHAYFLFDMGFQRDWYAVNDPESSSCAGNGRFMVFQSETFDALGGYEQVAHKVIEDEALGALVKEQGIPFRANGLIDLVEVRMYSSNADTIQGWLKTISGAFIDGNEGQSLSWSKAALFCVVILMKFFLWDAFLYLSLGLIILGYLPLWILPLSLGGIAIMHSNRWLFARTLGLNPWIDQLFHLPGLLSLLPIYFASIYKAATGTASWKGRKLT